MKKVGPFVKERRELEAARVLLDVNQSFSSRVTLMGREVAREVVLTLEPDRNNESKRAGNS